MKKFFLLMAASLLFQGCEQKSEKASLKVTSSAEKAKEEWLMQKLASCLPAHFSMDQLKELLKSGDLSAASKYVNVALQSSVKNPFLHILNGFIYDEMEKRGDSSRKELAAVAYQTAYNLDSTNWLAVYLLGAYKLRVKSFAEAQKFLADALILHPKDPDILYSLAYASYYLGDIALATASIEKAKALKPEDPMILRACAILYAASGCFDKAKMALEAYRSSSVFEQEDGERVEQRIEEWEKTHAQAKADYLRKMSKKSAKKGPISSKVKNGKKGKYHKVAGAPRLDEHAPPDAVGKNMLADLTDEMVLDEDPFATTKDPVQTELDEETKNPSTVVLECYCLRTDERNESVKGANLMETLTASLSSASAEVTRTLGRTTYPSSPTTGSWTKTFKLGASFSITKYALGIANAMTTNVEIMSRPMVVTVMGKPAVFEAGDSYAGASGGSTGAAVTSFNVGTAIEVTPKEMCSDGRVIVDVTITQSAFTKSPDRGRGIDDQMVGTIKSKLTSTVKVGFGQTIAIGGIYQKINIADKSGFPLLQDIPVLQYFFSKQVTRDQMNSSLYLITLRRGGSKSDTPSMFNRDELSPRQKLKKKGLMSFGEYPTLYYILKYMSNSPMFADFRSGDLIPPFWGYDNSSLDDKIHQLSSFLFF